LRSSEKPGLAGLFVSGPRLDHSNEEIDSFNAIFVYFEWHPV
jgi:hypothetical protein